MRKKQIEDKLFDIFNYLHERIITVIVICAILTAVISMIFILTDDKDQEESRSEIVEYESMDTVYFGMDKVKSLNPLSSREDDTYYISKLVFSSLFRLDDSLNIEPDLVSSYEADASDGSVRLELRDNAAFSDGTELTAYDVSYTVDQILSLGDDYPYYAYVKKIDYVEIEGDYACSIYFKKPEDAALDNLTFPIVSSYLYDRNDVMPLGSGMYQYDEYANGKVLTLTANENYYGTTAKNELVFKVISDKSKIPGLMTIDSVTAAVTTDASVAIDAEDKKLKVTQIPSNEMEYVGFNFTHKYLKDAKVRQAIAKTMDLENIIKDGYAGMGIISDTVYYPGFLGTENGGDPYNLDQVGASQLLKECGFTDSDENGVLEDKKGNEFELEILVNEDDESRIVAAESIAAELNKIGIKATVEKESWKTYKAALKDGKYDMFLGGYSFDSQYNLTELFTTKNYLRYSNKEVLSLVEQMETALSAEEQKEIFEKLKPILIEEIPYYCIAYKSYAFITVERLEASVIPSFHQRYAGCDSWQWERILTTKVEEETKGTEE